jgi:alanine dehydrogenase
MASVTRKGTNMRIGTVRERKDGEQRVGLTPEGAYALIVDGHTVVLETGAGEGSGHTDEAYVASGAQPLARASTNTSTQIARSSPTCTWPPNEN